MTTRNVHVRTYQRRTKSGKVVEVKAYTSIREAAQVLLEAAGRPPIAAQPAAGHGQYPRGRATPGVFPPNPKLKPPSQKHFAVRAEDARRMQGQTQGRFVHHITGHAMGKTEIGDTYEQMFLAKFAKKIEKRYGKLELVTGAGTGTARNTPLDFRTPTHGVEMKTINVRSKNQKTAIKAAEIDRKLKALAEQNLKPLLLVQVVDQDSGTVHVYGLERFASKAVSKMEHLGEYRYDTSDFQRAQEASGHAAKATGRAEAEIRANRREARVPGSGDLGGGRRGAEGSVGEGQQGPGEPGPRGRITGQRAHALLEKALHGHPPGFTYSVASNTSPKKGYSVSPFPERTLVVDTPDLTMDDIRKYAEDNKDLLSQDGYHIGAWREVDEANGTDRVWLDVSIVSQDRGQAEKLATQYNQKAIFDLAHHEVIDTGGTGGQEERAAHAGPGDRGGHAGPVPQPQGQAGPGVGLPGQAGSGGRQEAAPSDQGVGAARRVGVLPSLSQFVIGEGLASRVVGEQVPEIQHGVEEFEARLPGAASMLDHVGVLPNGPKPGTLAEFFTYTEMKAKGLKGPAVEIYRAKLHPGAADKIGTWFARYGDGAPTMENLERGVVTHELGHSVYTLLTRHQKAQLHRLAAEQLGLHPPKPPSEDALASSTAWHSETASFAQMMKVNRLKLEKELSIYGGSRRDEFFAECWAEYATNTNCRPLARAIGEQMERFAHANHGEPEEPHGPGTPKPKEAAKSEGDTGEARYTSLKTKKIAVVRDGKVVQLLDENGNDVSTKQGLWNWTNALKAGKLKEVTGGHAESKPKPEAKPEGPAVGKLKEKLAGAKAHVAEGGHQGKPAPEEGPTYKGLTPAQTKALKGYVDMTGNPNADLRAGKDHPAVKTLDSMLKPSAQSRVLYRNMPASVLADLEVGSTIKDAGYMSTASNPDDMPNYGVEGGKPPARMVITAPVGTPMIDVDKITGKPYESEMILPRGTLLAVTKVDPDGTVHATAVTGLDLSVDQIDELKAIPHGKGNGLGKGTIDDPINVKGDVQLAAKLLAEGKHVRLNKVSEVGTLLDELAKMVDEAKAKGKDAPVFDLCKVSVPKTNLFCAESKGVPRAKMPQFTGTEIEPGSPADKLERNAKGEISVEDQYRQALIAAGISITPRTVKASSLKASQIELDGPKVAGMSHAMEEGRVPDAPIFVTRDGYIIDGHHRWASKVSIDAKTGELGNVEMPVEELDMDIGEALDFANEFVRMMGIKPKGLGAAAEGVKESGKPTATSTHLAGPGEGPGEGFGPAFDGKIKPGDIVYKHSVGSVIVVHPDGTLNKYSAAGKPVAHTSATADKLAKGHGAWKKVEAPSGPVQVSEPKGITSVKPAEAAESVVTAPKPEPEVKSAPPPKASGKPHVPMVFNEAPVEDIPKYAADDNWFFQQKVDGIRGQLVIEPGKKPWFRSKSGNQSNSSTAAKTTDPILALLGDTVPADGQAYAVDGELLDGKWYIFDLSIGDNDKTPWEERMARAEAWAQAMNDAGIHQIVAMPTARTKEEKLALAKAVKDNGGEGVMMKRKDAPYDYDHRVNHTLKAKFVSTADVVVTELNPGGKDSVKIAVYEDDGTLRPLGTVTKLGKESKIGKIAVGDVIEVAYLYATEDGNVYQPRIVKKRPDKQPVEAVASQLRKVNKEVLDSGQLNLSGTEEKYLTPPVEAESKAQVEDAVPSAPAVPEKYSGKQYSVKQRDDALHDYAKYGYDAVNEVSRSGDFSNADPKVLQQIAAIDQSFTERFEEPTTLYRGMAVDPDELDSFDFKPGAVITDLGFMSTTRDHEIAEGFASMADEMEGMEDFEIQRVLININAPAGARYLDMPVWEDDKDVQFEDETLLPRGTRLRVTKVAKEKIWSDDKQKEFEYTVVTADAEMPTTGGLAMQVPVSGYDVHSQRGLSPEVTENEYEALDDYTTHGFEYWNDALRAGERLYARDRQHADDLRGLVEKGSADYPFTVYRGAIEDFLGPQMEPGTVITDDGFMSTTSDRTVAENDFTRGSLAGGGPRRGVIFTINAPAGASAISVPATKGIDSLREDEVLFAPGARLQVTNDTGPQPNGLREVTVDWLPPEQGGGVHSTLNEAKLSNFTLTDKIIWLANSAEDAWTKAIKEGIAHLLLVLKNNPAKSVGNALIRPDVQDALDYAGQQGAQAVVDEITAIWEANGGPPDSPYLASLIEDALRNGELYRQRMSPVLAAGNHGAAKAILERDRIRAAAGGDVAATRARTEAMLAQLQADGIPYAIWRAHIDDRTCPWCLALDGVAVPLGQSFPVDGPAPYFDLVGPPRHPNCRCELEPGQ